MFTEITTQHRKSKIDIDHALFDSINRKESYLLKTYLAFSLSYLLPLRQFIFPTKDMEIIERRWKYPSWGVDRPKEETGLHYKTCLDD